MKRKYRFFWLNRNRGFIVLAFLSLNCFSQKKLDFGEVQGKDFIFCNDSADGKICSSKYQLEISLTEATLLAGNYRTINLKYDDFKWAAKKYIGDWLRDTVITVDLLSSLDFETIFSLLKKNRIFTLPDQAELFAEGMAEDGQEYILSFKAGNKFRTYHFNNPSYYKHKNKNIIAFDNYVNIVNILFNLFEKQ